MSVSILSMPQYDAAFAHDFIGFPKDLYKGSPYWVPWFDSDIEAFLQRKKAFFEHGIGEFFLAKTGKVQKTGDITLGRIMVVMNREEKAEKKQALFYFFDSVNDEEASLGLIESAVDWARRQGAEILEGPRLPGAVAGAGILVKGFEERAAMTMMGYNYEYYASLLEGCGFKPEEEYHSAYVNPKDFKLPDRVASVAEKVRNRGNFRVLRFRNKKELISYSREIADLYMGIFGDEGSEPMSGDELERTRDEMLSIADPSLIKVLLYRDEPAGFIFAFPDLSPALQQSAGRWNVLTILRLLWEFRFSKRLIVNGAGILPRFRRMGGNALLYDELQRTLASREFLHAELVQISELNETMLKEIGSLGAEIYKTHRVYRREC